MTSHPQGDESQTAPKTGFSAFLAHPKVRATWDWLKEPLEAVVVVFVLATVVVQPFYVPSGSMQPTLAIGDAVLATKFPYGYSIFSIPYANGVQKTERLWGSMPKAGDVVVFRVPFNTKVSYVKRVIGLPGDRLQMKNGRLWINGKELPLEPANTGEVEDGATNTIPGQLHQVPQYTETLPNGYKHPIFKWQWDGDLDNTPEIVVPPGHLFMMGDNRDDSADSRVFGTVPLGNLAGKAVIIIGSVDFLNADSIFGWISQFRFSRVLSLIR